MNRGRALAWAWGIVLLGSVLSIWVPVLGFLVSGTAISIYSIYALVITHSAEAEGIDNVTTEHFDARMDRVEALIGSALADVRAGQAGLMQVERGVAAEIASVIAERKEARAQRDDAPDSGS